MPARTDRRTGLLRRPQVFSFFARRTRAAGRGELSQGGRGPADVRRDVRLRRAAQSEEPQRADPQARPRAHQQDPGRRGATDVEVFPHGERGYSPSHHGRGAGRYRRPAQ